MCVRVCVYANSQKVEEMCFFYRAAVSGRNYQFVGETFWQICPYRAIGKVGRGDHTLSVQ